jgi:hypothetical protein
LKVALLAAGIVLCLPFRPAGAANNSKQGIEEVTYTELGDLVKKNRGKVVVVDFWNIY